MLQTKLKKALNILIAISILFAAIIASFYILSSRPEVERAQSQARHPLVETMVPKWREHRTKITAMGRVIAAQQVTLVSRVNGEIVSVSSSLFPGGSFKKGEELLQIDPTDYELLVRQRESALIRAEYELALEVGKQKIAKQEYSLLGEKLTGEELSLILRKPHLKMARANVVAARSQLELARLELQRTRIKAPFNAIVQKTTATIGAQVTTATELATLINTDRYWVEVPISQKKLALLEVGGKARIKHTSAWAEAGFRRALVKSVKPVIGKQDHMAQVIVEIDDPMALEPANRGLPELMSGSFVQVEITGKTLPAVLHIPEAALRDGSFIWVVTENGELDIREVEIIWHETDMVYAKHKLAENERLITSDLAAPVEGMKLRF